MLSGMIKTDLNIIEADSGSVYHGFKNTDKGFKEFGEVYFSSVNYNAIKPWKCHKIMTLNLVVPVGCVLFGFVDGRVDSSTSGKKLKLVFSQDPYFRLTVPPGIWFSFRGLGKSLNLIVNIADIPHDSKEIERKKINEMKFDWSI
jgi:dTDP-4-dehydrorhamnose 3,5-epimerase